jgi:hypothetical protein
MVLTAAIALVVVHPSYCFGPLWNEKYEGIAEEVKLLQLPKYSDVPRGE